MAGGGDHPTGRGNDSWSFDEQRNADCLVERVVPLLLHTAVGAQQVAMVGGEHDDRVIGHARVVERLKDPADGLIDQLVEVVVEASIRHVDGLLGDHLRPELEELLLASSAGDPRSRSARGPRRCRARCRQGARTREAARRAHRRTRCRVD